MGKQAMSSVGGILLIVVLVLVGCVAPAAPAAGASRNAGGVRPGDTNVTNLVAEGDVAVGGDLTVAGECVGCGGGTTIETLDDIPTLSASQPMTVTNLTVAGTCTGCGAAGPKRYVALLSQLGADPPVATVLENTLGGAVVWTYYDVGQYLGTLAGAFPVAQTVILYPQGGFGSVWTTVDMGISADGNSIVVYAPLDGALNDSMTGNGRPLEVRVYP